MKKSTTVPHDKKVRARRATANKVEGAEDTNSQFLLKLLTNTLWKSLKYYSFDVFANSQVCIWHYMDFAKFISMLENQGLWFSRADKFKDAFEGTWPRQDVQNRAARLDDAENKKFSEDMQEQRAYFLVNCWHMNEQESDAMWKLCTKSNEAIAIRSTCGRLRSTLPSKIDIDRVNYIDYEKESIEDGNTLFPITFKGKSFIHEQELRAVWWLTKDSDFVQNCKTLPDPPKAGMWQSVNLDELIDAIYVAPTSPEWFKVVVEKVLVKYRLRKEVIPSKLDASPLF